MLARTVARLVKAGHTDLAEQLVGAMPQKKLTATQQVALEAVKEAAHKRGDGTFVVELKPKYSMKIAGKRVMNKTLLALEKMGYIKRLEERQNQTPYPEYRRGGIHHPGGVDITFTIKFKIVE
jgi:hypothetical protein